jgi:hypothetical protein
VTSFWYNSTLRFSQKCFSGNIHVRVKLSDARFIICTLVFCPYLASLSIINFKVNNKFQSFNIYADHFFT